MIHVNYGRVLFARFKNIKNMIQRQKVTLNLKHGFCIYGELELRTVNCWPTFAVCSLRFAVCGLRFAVCGLRFAVCGLRFAVCGLRFAV